MKGGYLIDLKNNKNPIYAYWKHNICFLLRYLIFHKVYDSYICSMYGVIEGYRINGNDFFMNEHQDRYIEFMSWRRSSEGILFWIALDKKYRRLISHHSYKWRPNKRKILLENDKDNG